MANEGKMIIVVPGSQKEKALELVRSTEEGKNAQIIAEINEGKGGCKDKTWRNKILDVSYGEGLPRIC